MSMIDTRSLVKTVAALVKTLSPRNRDIVSRRFGLKSGAKETLESIGKGYGITRERVRQIEEFSLAQLTKAVQDNKDVARVVTAVQGLVAKEGGVLPERALWATVTGSAKESVANASLVFILALDKHLTRVAENDRFNAFWSTDANTLESFRSATAALASALEAHGKVMTHDELLRWAGAQGLAGHDGAVLNQKSFATLTAISKDFGANIFGHLGLASWSEVHPKGVRDKAYLIMKREGSARHFSEIAKLINTAKFDHKKVNVQTVHNELIKDSRFVLVGRGLYALSEWGYKAGTVKDVLVDILREHGKPLPKADLVARVMDARMVKENTILLNLQDTGTFTKNADGTYHLRRSK